MPLKFDSATVSFRGQKTAVISERRSEYIDSSNGRRKDSVRMTADRSGLYFGFGFFAIVGIAAETVTCTTTMEISHSARIYTYRRKLCFFFIF